MSLSSCPDGWVAFHDHCFHITVSHFAHDQCVQRCSLMDGTLACIQGSEEQHFSAALAASTSPRTEVWTGHYLTSNMELCVSGKPTNASFTPWAPGQPNALESEHCVALWSEY